MKLRAISLFTLALLGTITIVQPMALWDKTKDTLKKHSSEITLGALVAGLGYSIYKRNQYSEQLHNLLNGKKITQEQEFDLKETFAPNCIIREYNESADKNALLDLMEKESACLSLSRDSAEYYLKYRDTDYSYALSKLMIKVLYHGDNLAGFAAYYYKEPGKGHLMLLAVDENYRRHGYATKLIQNVIDQVKTIRNASTLTLYTRKDNTRAQALYNKAGFIVIGNDTINLKYSKKI